MERLSEMNLFIYLLVCQKFSRNFVHAAELRVHVSNELPNLFTHTSRRFFWTTTKVVFTAFLLNQLEFMFTPLTRCHFQICKWFGWMYTFLHTLKHSIFLGIPNLHYMQSNSIYNTGYKRVHTTAMTGTYSGHAFHGSERSRLLKN